MPGLRGAGAEREGSWPVSLWAAARGSDISAPASHLVIPRPPTTGHQNRGPVHTLEYTSVCVQPRGVAPDFGEQVMKARPIDLSVSDLTANQTTVDPLGMTSGEFVAACRGIGIAPANALDA